MKVAEVIAATPWIERVIAQNDSAALARTTSAKGEMEVLFYTTTDGRPRMTQWYPGDDPALQRQQAGTCAINDGAVENDVLAVLANDPTEGLAA